MIPRVNFVNGSYSETCFENNINSDDDDSYSNIGLSLNSQELIRELHEALYDEESNQKKFEEIVYSILEDIQKYKRDYKKLEIAYKSEKERYEESIRQMVDEAEQQMFLSADKIRKAERLEAERIIEKLKQQHEIEINSLQMSLNKMILLEKKYHEDKLAEESRQNEFKKEIQNINDEKKNLTINLREYQTQISILRSEIAQLKSLANERDINKQKSVLLGKETVVLKKEISLLQETNKRLNDTNDVLLNEISSLKVKLAKKIERDQKIEKNTEPIIEMCHTISSTPIEKSPVFSAQFSYIPKSVINESYESDDYEEDDLNADSGIWQTNNESIFENELNKTSNYELNNSSSESKRLNLSVSPIFKEMNICKASHTSNNIIANSNTSSIKNSNINKFFKLVFAGDSAVGKTSFIMRYCKGEFSNVTSATLGVDFYMKSIKLNNNNNNNDNDDDDEIQLQLWDTCGQERFRSIAKSYFRRADGVVLMYDVTCEQSFLNVREWIHSINEISDRTVPIIIIGNKTDLRDDKNSNYSKCISYNDGFKFAKENGALFVETSIKDGTNVEQSLKDMCHILVNKQEDKPVKAEPPSIGFSLSAFNKKKLANVKSRCC